jgi:hypothetical protein
LDGSVRAITVNSPAIGALVMKHLVPVITYASPSLTAAVRSDAASLPASGSVSAKQPVTSPRARSGSHCAFCCGVPSATSASEPMPVLVPTRARKATEHCDSSMAARASSSIVMPAPPYCSGME